MPAKPPHATSRNDAGKACPVCGKPTVEAHTPFCSRRCKDVDLNRWLSGSYVIPGTKAEDEGNE
jgi:endogenous inhibitor of DNA gyrase (YacG/DUF329 family)